MLFVGLQRHEVNNVDDTNFDLRDHGTQNFHRSERFDRRDIPRTRHHHIGISTVITRPLPHAQSFRAVLSRLFHGEPLRLGLLSGNDQVHIVTTAHTVIGYGEKRVGIWRKVDANDFRLFVDQMIDESRILVTEPIVILPPHMRCEQNVQRRNRLTPWKPTRDFQPLRMLVEHRIDDVNERLVAVEKPVPSREQIALEPAFALMLAQHLHDSALAGEELVVILHPHVPLAIGGLEHGAQTIGEGFVRTEDPEVSLFRVKLNHVTKEDAELVRVGRRHRTRRRYAHRIIPKVRHIQVAQQGAAVGVGIGAHAPLSPRSEFGQLRLQATAFLEKLLRPIALHPAFQHLEVLGMRGVNGERDLVRTEGAFDLYAVDHLRPGPAFGRIQDDHRPARPLEIAAYPSVTLEGLDFLHRRVERRGHGRVHQFRLMTLDEIGRPAVAAQQLFQLQLGDAGKQGRIGDLVAVEMKNRQNRSVGGRIEELVGVPGGGQRSGFRLAVSDDAGDDEIRIIEHCSERMAEGIAQLAALVDRARTLRRGMAGNTAGKGKLLKKLLKPGLVAADVGIDFAVGALEVGMGHDGRPAVSGAGDEDHVEVVFFDHPVQVRIDEVLAGSRTPMPQLQMLHIPERERPSQQGIIPEINLADRQIIRRAPIGVDLA